MNGDRTGRSSYDYGAFTASPPASSHSENAMTYGFEKRSLDEFDKAALRSDPMKRRHVEISSLADLGDPIQVHLLTEIALSDSKEYEILTQEEVDRLKKLNQSLRKRVELTRANLAIQSKYRDAAISMTKLYITGKPEDSLRNDQSAREAAMEREATEKNCEELTRELFSLEKRLLIPQQRLLQHTAGILQLNHKATKRKAQPPALLNNGIPGSPESLYTYSHYQDSLDPAVDDNYFDDSNIYQLDSLEGLQTRQPQKNAIEIPLKSPVREQAYQLRGDLDKAREENTLLIKTMSEAEHKLRVLNVLLRDTIVKFNPEVKNDYLDLPDESAPHISKPGGMLISQMDYLEGAIVAAQAERDSFTTGGESADQIEPVLIGLWSKIQSGFAETKQRKEERRKHRQERGLLDDDDASDDDGFDASEAYSLTAFSSKVQWLYSQASTLKDQKSVLKRQIKQQRELNNKTDAEKDEEIERRKEELEQTRQLLDRAEKDALDAQSMLSDTLQEVDNARAEAGPFGATGEVRAQHAMIESLEAEIEARSTRIESLEAEVQARSAKLESLDSEVQAHDTRTKSLKAEIEAHSARIESLESEVQARSSRIESLEGEVQARITTIESLKAEVLARSEMIESFEAKVAALKSENNGTGQKMVKLSSQLDEATRDKAAAEEAAKALQQEVENSRTDLSSKKKELARKDDEMELLNMTLAELKTEATIARAELDGAYGTRAERAADVAALKNNAEVVKLSNHVERLKKELAGTVQDLEAIAKETIGAERQRLDLEQRLDEVSSAKTAVEVDLEKSRDQISRLQEELDNERFKVVPGQGGTSRLGPGASMLSEQFRATMREERKKFQEEIREERARCRRLDEELNRLKRSQGPGKSPLSPR